MPEEVQDTTEMVDNKPAGETPAANPAPTAPTETVDVSAKLAELEKALKAANRESAERRKKLEAYEKAEQEKRDAELSEADKAKKKAAELEAQLTAARDEAHKVRVENAIITRATGRFIDVEDVVQRLAAQVELDETGKPTNLDKLLDDLAKAKPHWLKQAAPEPPKQGQKPIPPTNPGANANTGHSDDEIRAMLGLGPSSRNNLFTPENAQKFGGGVVEVSKTKGTAQ